MNTETGGERVPGIWKHTALILVGLLIGGSPGYISLLIDRHTAVTLIDVDNEITKQNAVVIEKNDELSNQIMELNKRLDMLTDKLDQDGLGGKSK